MPFSRSRRTVADDVLGAQRDVLAAGRAIPVEVLLDLALLLARGRLVDRELDPAVAVGHDLRHQRAVVGVDDLVVVVDELGEAQDVAVEVDEGVHLAEPDVADAVIDLEQRQPAGGRGGRRDLAVAGRERAVVVAPVDERVQRLAVGPDRSPAQDAVLATVELHGLQRRDRPAGRRLAPGRFDVGHGERDVVDAVAVRPDVLGDLAVRGQRRREHEPDPVLDHDVARPVADLRLEAAEGDRREPPQGAVVGGGLAGVADPELDVVDAVERQEIGRPWRRRPHRPGRRPGWRRPGTASRSWQNSAAAVWTPSVVAPGGRRTGPRRWSVAPSYALACDTGAHDDAIDGDHRARPHRRRSGRLRGASSGGSPTGSPGRSPTTSAPDPRRRGVRARCSATWPRCCRSGWARWNASWPARPAPRRSGGSPTTTLRLGIIERDRSLPLPVLFGRIEIGLRDWAARIADADRGRAGRRRAASRGWGEVTSAAFLETFVLGHAEDHVAQLEAILAAACRLIGRVHPPRHPPRHRRRLRCWAGAWTASATCTSDGPGSPSPASSSRSSCSRRPSGACSAGTSGRRSTWLPPPAVLVAVVLRTPRLPGIAHPGHGRHPEPGGDPGQRRRHAHDARRPSRPAGLADRPGFSNSAVLADPALAPLTDVFALPAWFPLANVFSIGDVLIGLGVAVLLAIGDAPPATDSATTPPDGDRIGLVRRSHHTFPPVVPVPMAYGSAHGAGDTLRPRRSRHSTPTPSSRGRDELPPIADLPARHAPVRSGQLQPRADGRSSLVVDPGTSNVGLAGASATTPKLSGRPPRRPLFDSRPVRAVGGDAAGRAG